MLHSPNLFSCCNIWELIASSFRCHVVSSEPVLWFRQPYKYFRRLGVSPVLPSLKLTVRNIAQGVKKILYKKQLNFGRIRSSVPFRFCNDHVCLKRSRVPRTIGSNRVYPGGCVSKDDYTKTKEVHHRRTTTPPILYSVQMSTNLRVNARCSSPISGHSSCNPRAIRLRFTFEGNIIFDIPLDESPTRL